MRFVLLATEMTRGGATDKRGGKKDRSREMEESGEGGDGQEYKERDKFLRETSTRRGKGEILQCTHVIL